VLQLRNTPIILLADSAMVKRISLKKMRNGISKILAFLFVILYVVGTSNLDLLHKLVHKHKAAVTHNEEQEKDHCHRLIYHNDVERGCNHHSHSIVSDNCQMCDMACHGDQSIVPDISFGPTEFSSEHFDFYKQSLGSYWAVISSSRAPPALI
jgi:hypothetical protein